MTEPHAPDLLLRLSLPSARDFASVAPEVVTKISEALGRGGISAKTDFYGPGNHDWPYWERELRRALPTLTS